MQGSVCRTVCRTVSSCSVNFLWGCNENQSKTSISSQRACGETILQASPCARADFATINWKGKCIIVFISPSSAVNVHTVFCRNIIRANMASILFILTMALNTWTWTHLVRRWSSASRRQRTSHFHRESHANQLERQPNTLGPPLTPHLACVDPTRGDYWPFWKLGFPGNEVNGWFSDATVGAHWKWLIL